MTIKAHYRGFWRFTTPIFFYKSMSMSALFVDSVFAGLISERAVAAVIGVSPIIYGLKMFTSAIAQATASGIQQSRGSRDPHRAHAFKNAGIYLSGGISVLLIFILYAAEQPIIYLLGFSTETASIAIDYFQVIVIFVALMVFTDFLIEYNNISNRPNIVLASTVIFFASNLTLNYTFYHFPIVENHYSVADLALATVFTRAISIIPLLIGAGATPSNLATKAVEGRHVITATRWILSKGLMSSLEHLSHFLFAAVAVGLYVRLGDAAAAARAYAGNFLFLVGAWPWAVATWGRLGISYAYGAGRHRIVRLYFQQTLSIAALGFHAVLVLTLLFFDTIIPLLTEDPQVVAFAHDMLLIAVVGELFRVGNVHMVNAFLATGNNKAFATGNILLTWTIGLPLLLYSYFAGYGFIGVTIAYYVDQAIRFFYALHCWYQQRPSLRHA